MSALLKGFLSLLFVFFWSYFTCGEGTCKEGPKEKTMLWKVTSDAPAFFSGGNAKLKVVSYCLKDLQEWIFCGRISFIIQFNTVCIPFR